MDRQSLFRSRVSCHNGYLVPVPGYSGTRSFRLLFGIHPLLEDDADENRDDNDGKDGDHEHHEEDIVCHVSEVCKDHHKGGSGVPGAGPNARSCRVSGSNPPKR